MKSVEVNVNQFDFPPKPKANQKNNDDPFADKGKPIDISSEDLPF
jgi:single-stranded DNA-binding protein